MSQDCGNCLRTVYTVSQDRVHCVPGPWKLSQDRVHCVSGPCTPCPRTVETVPGPWKLCPKTVETVSQDRGNCVPRPWKLCHRTVETASQDRGNCVTGPWKLCHRTLETVSQDRLNLRMSILTALNLWILLAAGYVSGLFLPLTFHSTLVTKFVRTNWVTIHTSRQCTLHLSYNKQRLFLYTTGTQILRTLLYFEPLSNQFLIP